MKKFVVVFLFLSLIGHSASYAQQTEREQGRGVYFELFGSGLTYSINYDQRFEKRFDGLGFKAGLSYIGVDGTSVATFPLGLNYLLGKNGKYFEMGLGGTYLAGADRSNTFFTGDGRTTGDGFVGNLILGYRSEPQDGGFLFRASVTPMFGSGFFWPFYAGFSFGYAF